MNKRLRLALPLRLGHRPAFRAMAEYALLMPVNSDQCLEQGFVVLRNLIPTQMLGAVRAAWD